MHFTRLIRNFHLTYFLLHLMKENIQNNYTRMYSQYNQYRIYLPTIKGVYNLFYLSRNLFHKLRTCLWCMLLLITSFVVQQLSFFSRQMVDVGLLKLQKYFQCWTKGQRRNPRENCLNASTQLLFIFSSRAEEFTNWKPDDLIQRGPCVFNLCFERGRLFCLLFHYYVSGWNNIEALLLGACLHVTEKLVYITEVFVVACLLFKSKKTMKAS